MQSVGLQRDAVFHKLAHNFDVGKKQYKDLQGQHQALKEQHEALKEELRVTKGTSPPPFILFLSFFFRLLIRGSLLSQRRRSG